MRCSLRYSRNMPGDEAPIEIVDTAMPEAARQPAPRPLRLPPARRWWPQGLEGRLPNELERTTGARGRTMGAFALVTAP